MYKKIWIACLAVVLCALFTVPVLAVSTDAQGGGGVRFGAFTLETGNTTSGDMVVFGGPVTLEEESYFDGDLTVFGVFVMKSGVTLDGQLVVLGDARVSGLVDGNVFVAGPVFLGETAYIDGDLSVVGDVSQDEGAIVVGEIIPIDKDSWDLPINIGIPDPVVVPITPAVETVRVPFWIKAITTIARAVATVVILTLLSLVAASLWPQHIERVGRTIEEAALISFGTGLLTLILVSLAAILLIITICLSPFAIIGLIVLSLCALLGWIALGLVLGRKILSGLFNQTQPQTVLAAVVGTGLLTLLLVMSQVSGFLHTLLIFLLVPPAVGAVILSRFGTMPYATRGGNVNIGPNNPPQMLKVAPLPGEFNETNQDSAVPATGSTQVVDLDDEIIVEPEKVDEKPQEDEGLEE